MHDSVVSDGIQVSFPDKCILSFKQKKCFAQNALVLADVDNDSKGDIELTVGGIGGMMCNLTSFFSSNCSLNICDRSIMTLSSLAFVI